MRDSFDKFLGSRPFLYGRDLLKRMDVRGHYVNEYDVVDFLGYEVKEVDPSQYSEYQDVIGDIFDDTWAISIRERNLILLSKSIPPRQQRISLFHESGHDVIPYHQAHSFSVRGKDTDPMIHKAIEREAFHAGSEVMYTKGSY